MKEVIFEMRGGLGNQMFQAAAALGLAASTGRFPVLDMGAIPLPTGDPVREHIRDDVLDTFRTLAGVRRLYRRAGLIGRVERAGRRLRPSYREPEGLIGFDPDFPSRATEQRFAGYFMSWRYFGSAMTGPRALFGIGSAPSSRWFRQQLAHIQRERPIALHVRLGDYQEHTSVYGALGPTYYERALREVIALVGQRPVWVFSDDSEAAAIRVDGLGASIRFVDHPASEHPLMSLWLMSQADALIGANSSFSWWAAYLATRAHRPNAFPYPHFVSDALPEPQAYYPPAWMRIPRGV